MLVRVRSATDKYDEEEGDAAGDGGEAMTRLFRATM